MKTLDVNSKAISNNKLISDKLRKNMCECMRMLMMNEYEWNERVLA